MKKKEKEIRRSVVEIEWYVKREKREEEKIITLSHTIPLSVELNIRFLVPCFYANICRTLEGFGLVRDKKTTTGKDNGDN